MSVDLIPWLIYYGRDESAVPEPTLTILGGVGKEMKGMWVGP